MGTIYTWPGEVTKYACCKDGYACCRNDTKGGEKVRLPVGCVHLCRRADGSGRHPELFPEASRKMGGIAEANLICDLGNGTGITVKQIRRPLESQAPEEVAG